MPQENLIPAEIFCTRHDISLSFIETLHEFGLIEVSTVGQSIYIAEKQLPDLEKMVRFHFDMDINLEGIETISYLLGRLENMEHELMALKNRLKMYESL